MFLHRSFALSLITLLPFTLIGCSGHQTTDPRTQAPLVSVALVQPGTAESLSLTGVVAARVQSDLGFRVSGKVVERLVDAGQTVKRGQALMKIDPVDLQLAQHAQQEAAIAAKAKAHQTTADEERYRDLVSAGAISASNYDQVKAAADSSKALQSAAEAQAGAAKNAASYATLYADSDGVVTETLAEPGQVVAAGQVVIRVAREGKREAVIQIPETLHPVLGSKANATLFGMAEIAEARLRQIAGAADRLTRTFEARYVLSGALVNAPIGATVTITLPSEQASKSQAIQVPIGAVFDPGTGPGVWVVTGKPLHANWRPVKIVALESENALVEGSLQQGEQVVALGAQLIHEGEEVRTSVDSKVEGAQK